MTMTNHTGCSCGETAPHVIARRMTADRIGVEFWHDGAITGRIGRAIPGVPIARPRTQESTDLAQAAASLVAGEVELYDVCELPRLVSCARRVASLGGLPGDLRAMVAAPAAPSITLEWVTYAADRSGTPTVRVARLDRIRWPGLVIWHERGKYEVLSVRGGVALGAQSLDALETTGISFKTQRELIAHLMTYRA